MKRIKNIVLIAFMVLVSYTASSYNENNKKAPAGNFIIEGNINGLPDNIVVTLSPSGTYNQEKAIQRVTAVNGKFTFSENLGERNCYFVGIDGFYGGKQIMVENSIIKLEGSVTLQGEGDNARYNFEEVIISGSKLQKEFDVKYITRNKLDSLYTAYHQNNKQISDAIASAHKAKDTILYKKLLASDAYNKLASDEKEFFIKVEATSKKIISDNKDSWWGPFMMMQVYTYLTPDVIPQYETLSDIAKESFYGKFVKKELFPDRLVGKSAPDFTVSYIGSFTGSKLGSTTTLTNLIAGKKIILVDFWASWCNPCRKEIPNLKAIYEKLSGKGLEIISLSIDKKESDWLKAMAQEQLPWPSFIDPQSEIFHKYIGKVIPTMFILDTNGIVLYDNLRGEELAKKLEDLLR